MWSLPSGGTQAGGRDRDVTLVLQFLKTSWVLTITPIFQAIFFFLLGSPVYEEFRMWPPFWCYTETQHSGASKRQAIGQKPRRLSWDDWHLGKEHPKTTFSVYPSALERDMAYYIGQNRYPVTPWPPIHRPIHGVVVKKIGFVTKWPGAESCFYHLSAVWPWAAFNT